MKDSEPAYHTSGKPGNSQNAHNGELAIAQEIAMQRRKYAPAYYMAFKGALSGSDVRQNTQYNYLDRICISV